MIRTAAAVRYVAAILAFSLCLGGAASGETAGKPLRDKLDDQISVPPVLEAEEENRYYSVLARYEQNGYHSAGDVTLELPLDKAASSARVTYEDVNGVPALIWDAQDYLEWQVEVPADGLYEAYITYYPLEGKGVEIQRKLKIDGEKPFDEADNIVLHRSYTEADSVIRTDRLGNDVRPEVVETAKWQTAPISDGRGAYKYPFRYYLTAGVHTLRLEMLAEPMAVSRVALSGAQDVRTYAEYKTGHAGRPEYSGAQLKIQAEEAGERNTPALRRESNGDLVCEPYSYSVKKLNVIGDTSWQAGGSSVSWEVEAPQTGLYQLSMHCGQWYNDGLPTYREIRIDGEVPFAELQAYPFRFDNNWYMQTLGDGEGNPYLFYLEQGSHTLTMTVSLAEYQAELEGVKSSLLEISGIYREIRMLTGADIDVNYQYDFYQNIPNLKQRFSVIEESLKAIENDILQKSKKRPGLLNNIISIGRLIADMSRDEFQINKRLDELYTATTDLGTWITSLEAQPLTLDYLVLSRPGETVSARDVSLLDHVKSFLTSFYYSFVKDYNNIGVTGDVTGGAKVLDVWVGRANQWVEVLNQLVEESFTARTGIVVKTNVIPAGQLSSGSVNPLMLSLVSGTAPDVALGVDSNSPVEFAIRNAVVDLSGLSGFDSVAGRFTPQLFTPYRYQEGVYALPETMNFLCLFYRRDILAQIGLKVPNTWQQVYDTVIPKLNQNSMQFYYGSGLNLLMFQNGADFYQQNGKYSNLGSEEAYQAFSQWTQLYTNYNVPVSANFFNRFRSGEIPIGIGGAGDYIQFSTIAPELYGKWDIAPVPAQVNADGTLNRTTTGIAGTSAVIFSQSEMKEEAWRFLDWWTSEETQTRYEQSIEAVMGMTARWTSANLKAFEKLPWKEGHGELILGQIANAREVEVVLGGYFTARHVSNAFTRVITMGVTPRESLEKAARDIDKELKAKQEEYGYFYE